MNIVVFNVSMILGWLMFAAGSILRDLPSGLMMSGALLLVLALLGVRMAGGLYSGRAESRGL